jgi:acyl transferase domain-containing protein
MQDAIAIVGMSGRFPQAPSIEALWRLLCAGKEGLEDLTPDRLDGDPDLFRRPGFVPRGGYLDNYDQFDAAFFGFTRREAEATDPQHRLLLECAWEAMEDAGLDPLGVEGPAGVYAGAGLSGYGVQTLLRGGAPSSELFERLMGVDKDYLATRVAYKLGLQGPAMTVGTACSTSMVAVALACQHLNDLSVDLAIAGGASVAVPHRTGYVYQDGGILSPDGRCRAWDEAAAGTVPGNGVGVVVLQRLEDAMARGARIYAVIRGIAVNNDGRAKVGYTAPSVEGQARVIADALSLAGVEPEAVGYIETHGTGTQMGDPIELQALMRVHGHRTRGSCGIGSIKTNLGHLNAASGVTGLIKAALCLHEGQIPPSLHFSRPNPHLRLEEGPFRVVQSLERWPRGAAPRVAAVSSFGFGGTNVHAVLQEAPRPAAQPASGDAVLVVSARTEAALTEASQRLADHLEAHPALPLADVASTLARGRHAFRHRRVIAAVDVRGAVSALRATPAAAQGPWRRELRGEASGEAPAIVFLFPGQGAQHPDMGRALYEANAAFRSTFDRAADAARPGLGLDLRALVRGELSAEALRQTRLAQPALAAVSLATAAALQAEGLQPTHLLGHSLGELAAAIVGGACSLEEGMALIVARARAMAAQPAGAMCAVWAGEETIAPWLGDGVHLAAENGPTLTAVGGDADAIARFEERCAAAGIRTRPLVTSHAFHGPTMEGAVAPLVQAAARVRWAAARVPLYANVTGALHPAGALSPAYWGEQLRRPVRMASALGALLARPNSLFIEVGPGPTLAAVAAAHPACQQPGRICSALAGAGETAALPPPSMFRRALATAWAWGAPVRLDALAPAGAVVSLPTSPLRRQRFWMDETPLPRAEAPVAGPVSLDLNAFVDVIG